MEDHPLNPNPSSNWQTFFKYSDFCIFILMIFPQQHSPIFLYEWKSLSLVSYHSLSRDRDVLLQILCPGTTMCCYKLTKTFDDFVRTSHSFNRCLSEENHAIKVIKHLPWEGVWSKFLRRKGIFQATPHPHRLLVGDPDEGVPPREKLHARVTQVML